MVRFLLTLSPSLSPPPLSVSLDSLFSLGVSGTLQQNDPRRTLHQNDPRRTLQQNDYRRTRGIW